MNHESTGATWLFLINVKQQLLTMALNSILMKPVLLIKSGWSANLMS